MSELKHITEQLENLIQQLDYVESIVEDKFAITETAEKQGFDDTFTYYTLDNEYKTHYPHIHICVAKDNSRWDGKPLRSGNPLKSVASVKLNRVTGFTPQNLEFGEIKDTKIENTKYKKEICKWLNSNFNGKRTTKETNAYRCLNSYLMNNDGYYNEEAEKLLD